MKATMKSVMKSSHDINHDINHGINIMMKLAAPTSAAPPNQRRRACAWIHLKTSLEIFFALLHQSIERDRLPFATPIQHKCIQPDKGQEAMRKKTGHV